MDGITASETIAGLVRKDGRANRAALEFNRRQLEAAAKAKPGIWLAV